MSGSGNNAVTKLVQRVFPKMPDFFGALDAQTRAQMQAHLLQIWKNIDITIVFITLKLTGHIDWSWWWVLSPIWITALIVMAILAVALAVHALK